MKGETKSCMYNLAERPNARYHRASLLRHAQDNEQVQLSFAGVLVQFRPVVHRQIRMPIERGGSIVGQVLVQHGDS
jgi:hypothetical protein